MISRMLPHAVAAAFLCAALLQGCGPAPVPREATAPAPPVSSRTVALGSASCFHGARRSQVLADEAAWRAWVGEFSCGGDIRAGSADFTREAVVAVDGEDATNGCHALRITGIERTPSGAVVHVERYVPAPDAVCAAVMGHPFHAVAVDRGVATGPLTFDWKTVTGRPAP